MESNASQIGRELRERSYEIEIQIIATAEKSMLGFLQNQMRRNLSQRFVVSPIRIDLHDYLSPRVHPC